MIPLIQIMNISLDIILIYHVVTLFIYIDKKSILTLDNARRVKIAAALLGVVVINILNSISIIINNHANHYACFNLMLFQLVIIFVLRLWKGKRTGFTYKKWKL